MLPTLLTARPGPQTLLLTALALLIAAATIMLACGPVAQPIPEGGDTLAAAPQAAGGGEEPEEPDAPPPAEPQAEGGEEQAEPTATPTVEPTNTPTPYPTQCIILSPELHDTPPDLDEDQILVDGLKMQCFSVTPTPTPKYPELGELTWIAAAGEEAEAQRAASQAAGASGASGASGQAEIEIPIAYVVITTTSNTADVVAWLQSKGLPLPQDRVEGDKAYISSYRVDWELGDDFIYAYVPGSLLVPLSKQTGVVRIDRVTSWPTPN